MRPLITCGILLALLAFEAAAAQAAPSSIPISPNVDQEFHNARAGGAALDTSAAALGDPSAPTQEDVTRDFARLHWPANVLPAPSVLSDPKVREWLAMVNLPGAGVSTTQIRVPAPATAPAWQSTPAASAARAPRAKAAQLQLYPINCSASFSAYSSHGVGYETGSFACPIAVFYEDLSTWYSLYTGHIIDGPFADWNFTSETPTASAVEVGATTAGQDGHRSVHWDLTLCAPGGTCGPANFILHE